MVGAQCSKFYKAQRLTFWDLDLDPLDYDLWNVLEEEACLKHHPNLETLLRSIVAAAVKIPLERIREAIAEWPSHLQRCIDVEGGHFE